MAGYDRNNREPDTGIDTADLLLGLLREPAGKAAQLLEGFRVTTVKVEQQLALMSSGDRDVDA